jgi:arylsulfatase A-like enzyme
MKIRKITFIMVVICLAALLAVTYLFIIKRQGLYQDPQKKHNVLIIISDALRYDALGCYGGKAETPNIDWLANNGILFQRAYSNSPWTSPSSVSMLTGNYASVFENGVRIIAKGNRKASYQVPEHFRTLPEILSSLNYETLLSLFNWNVAVTRSVKGFHRFKKFAGLKQKEKVNVAKVTGIKGYNKAYTQLYAPLNYFLEQKEKPFFSLVWINDPHSPYDPIDKFKRKRNNPRPDLRKNLDYYTKVKSYHIWEGKKVKTSEIDYIRDLYLAEVESVDERVGCIIKVLKHKDLLKDTIIIFSSDHGEAFGQHGLFDHSTSYYDDLLHIPLIIFGPNIPTNLKITTPVSLLSLMPTIKDLLGLSYHDNFQGESLIPLIKGEPFDIDPIYFDGINRLGPVMKNYVDAVFFKNFKLIALENNEYELYDLLKDGSELQNLEAEKEAMVKELQGIILAMRKTNSDLRKKYWGTDINKIIKQKKKDVLKNLKSLGYIE